MKTLISIDPGKSTGIAVGTYSDSEPFTLARFFQIEGGVEGFIDNVSVSENGYGDTLVYVKLLNQGRLRVCFGDGVELKVIAEKFNARGKGNGFSYTTESLEALRVEGAILALGIQPTWVQPAQQYFAGGDSKSSTTNAHRWLKANDLHITGGDVGCKDANDARSALLHCISYLRRQKHMPTIEKYFPKEDSCS